MGLGAFHVPHLTRVLLGIEAEHYPSGNSQLVRHDGHRSGVLLVITHQDRTLEHRGQALRRVPGTGAVAVLGAIRVVAVGPELGLDGHHLLEGGGLALGVLDGQRRHDLGDPFQFRQRGIPRDGGTQFRSLLLGGFCGRGGLQSVDVPRFRSGRRENLLSALVEVGAVGHQIGPVPGELQPARRSGQWHPDPVVLADRDLQSRAGLDVLGDAATRAQVVVGVLGHVEHVAVVGVHDRQSQPAPSGHAGDREQGRVLLLHLVAAVAHQGRGVVAQVQRGSDVVAQHVAVSVASGDSRGHDRRRDPDTEQCRRRHRPAESLGRLGLVVHQDVSVVGALGHCLVNPHPHQHARAESGPEPRRGRCGAHPHGDAHDQQHQGW